MVTCNQALRNAGVAGFRTTSGETISSPTLTVLNPSGSAVVYPTVDNLHFGVVALLGVAGLAASRRRRG